MSSTFESQSAYPQLVTLANDAFDGGHVAVAYHLLMAAMHSAEETADTDRLQEVAQTCRQMLKTLDGQERPHPLSSRGSERRSTPNVFESGARTAELMITGLKANATIQRTETQA